LNKVIDLRNAPADREAAHGGAGSLYGNPQAVDPRGIAFITPVKDEAEAQAQYRICLRYLEALQVPSGYSVEKLAVYGGASMAEKYQRGMEASRARYKIYLHVDAYLAHRGMLFELLNLFTTYPRLGMIGVIGATQLRASVLFSVNNPFHCYGREWNYRRPGGPWSLLGPANRRRLHFTKFRSFVGDYLPAVVVDGYFMATQYDIPWIHPQFGFDLYDQVQAVEFTKAGFEVGIARQEAVWCLHWGLLQEPSRQQQKQRQIELRRKAAVIRELYSAFINVPAQRLYEQHWRGVKCLGQVIGEFGNVATARGVKSSDVQSSDPVPVRLGVVIVTFNGREILLRALQALLPECAALTELEYRVVVVDNASTDGTAEAVRQEFPQVTVIANASNDGPARGFNLGLRHLGFPTYVLVMNNDVEFPTGALARMVSYLREYPSTAGVVASLVEPSGTIDGSTCALARGEVFFDVGFYDERFSSCLEDLDWSLRARRKGYKFVYLPEARVLDYRRGRLRRNGPGVFAERSVASLQLAYKHGGRRRAAALYWIQRMQAKLLALRWRHDREALRQVGTAMEQTKGLYRRFREENRRPQLL